MTTPQRKKTWLLTSLLALSLGIVGTATVLYGYEETEEIERFAEHLDMIDGILDLIDDMTEITSSPSSSGVAAVFSAKDYFEEEAQAIDYFEDLLSKANDPVVRRALRLELADLHKENDQPKKGLEHLRALILQTDQ